MESQNIGNTPQVYPRFKLFSIEEMKRFPTPEWLVEGLSLRGSYAALIGPPGEGKSFLALGVALHVASARAWNGRRVKGGPVIYVASEGVGGLMKRVEAWRTHCGVGELNSMFFMRDAPQLVAGGDLGPFLDRILIQNVKPELIVIDTFARSFVGKEENSAKDVGEFNEAVRCLIQQTGAAVLALHHTRKGGNRSDPQERGSTSLRGAVDTMMQLKKQAEFLTLTCIKQKDAAEFEPVDLRLKVVDLDGDSSCVLEAVTPASLSAEYEGALLSASERSALEVLLSFPGHAEGSGAWQAAIKARTKKALPSRTFQNWRDRLLKGGFIAGVDGQRGHYYVTAKGSAIANGTSPSAIQIRPVPACATTP